MARRRKRSLTVVSDSVKEEMGRDITPPRLWLQEIEDAKGRFKDYWDKCDLIFRRYVDEENSRQDIQPGKQPHRKYNVLWSIKETMQPLVYGAPPKPFVTRMHMDKDPVGRDAAMILQRAIEASLEDEQLHYALEDCASDFILLSRGAPWIKYKPFMKLRQPEGKEPFEEKVYEECEWEHVHHRHFLHGAAAKWKHVPWVARMVPMTREELVERFGDEMGKMPPLTINVRSKHGTAPNRGKQHRTEISDEEKGLFAKAEIWEVWCKKDRTVKWLCPDYPESLLDEQRDFLGLDSFFPCPKPAYSTHNTDTLTPTPDFVLWQDIANELDEVTFRIKLLTESLRVVGVYNKEMGDIANRLTKQTNENDLIGVDSYAMFSEKGGLKGQIEYLPIDMVMNVLQNMYNARTQLKQELYEITGISDIVRGATDPRETARAQAIKGEFANKRLKQKQGEMLRLARDCMELQSEIICKHYSLETIELISSASQVVVDPMGQPDINRFISAIRLLKSDTVRTFRVKVDEENLAIPDLAENREMTMQFLTGVSQFVDRAVAAAQMAPGMVPLLGDLLQMGVRSYPMARSLESSIQAGIDQLKQMEMPKEEPPPRGKTPEELQFEGEMHKQKMELERQRLLLEKQKADHDYEIRQNELAFSSEGRAEELRLKQNRDQGELLIQGEQVELSKKQHADNFALQYGKLEAETGINERKMVQDAELKREELDTKRTVETGKLLLADEKQQQDNEAAEREAEQAEYEKAEKAAKEEESSKQGADILVGLKEILESHQKESSENQQSLAEILKAVSEQQSTIMKTLTSPRKIVRGADGRVERMEIAG